MKEFKRYVALCVFIILTGMGAAITLKAAIGVGAWDAFAQTLSNFTKIKVGTISIIVNSLCVVGEILILKKDFKLIQLLQVPVSILLGSVINIIYYDVLGRLELNNYFLRFILLIIGYVFIAFVVGAVVVLNKVTLAIEGLCLAVSQKTNIAFSKLRQAVDIICIVIILIMTFVFSLPFTIREGTVIGMIIYGPLIGIFMKRIKVWFKKLDLID